MAPVGAGPPPVLPGRLRRPPHPHPRRHRPGASAPPSPNHRPCPTPPPRAEPHSLELCFFSCALFSPFCVWPSLVDGQLPSPRPRGENCTQTAPPSLPVLCPFWLCRTLSAQCDLATPLHCPFSRFYFRDQRWSVKLPVYFLCQLCQLLVMESCLVQRSPSRFCRPLTPPPPPAS